MTLKRGVWFYFSVFFIFVIVISFLFRVKASSAGVSPGIYEINFKPGYEGDFSFSYTFGTDSYSYDIYAEGDLAQYITLDKNSLTGSGGVTAHLKLPLKIEEPGTHRIVIWARPNKTSLQKSGGVGAVPAVGGVIKVNVPYPGKYAEIEFQIDNSNEGEKTPFNLKIYSKGKESVNTSSRIKVLDFSNKSVGNFDLGNDLIEPTEHITIDSEIDTSNYGSGNYQAIAVVSYESGQKTAEANFKIGELYVGITNYTSEIEKNKINPFFIEIESFWNDPIENVYAEVFVNETSFLTPSVTLLAWQKSSLNSYFDATGIEADSIPAKIVVHYEEKTTEESISINLVKSEKGNFEINYLFVALAGLIVLFIVFFVWFSIRLKKLEKKGGKKKKF